MFDANMRHLPKGRRFFAEVFSVSPTLKGKGLNLNDLVLCHMLNSNDANPCVDMMIKGKVITVSSDNDFYGNWFVYAGNIDGTGFIDEELKRIAMNIVNKII